MNHTINFGIDLGTTKSAIAVFENGEITVFKNPRTLKQTIPSVVAFKGDRIIVGEKAAELLYKEVADVFGGFKRRMGSMDRYALESQQKTVSPIDLTAIVLKELKGFLQGVNIPDSVVITIPAAFDTNQSNATKNAGYAAGFKEVVLLQEPIAASLAYANSKHVRQEEGKWIVFDFGGGTFDVALTGIIDDEMQVLDHEGDNFLGGKDIDRAIVENFIIPALEKSGSFSSLLTTMRNTNGIYHRLYNKLIYLAEEAKVALSTLKETDIEFDTIDEAGKKIDVLLTINQATLDEIAQPYNHRALELVDSLLRRNEIGKEDVKSILLVGGTTYIPAIRRALTEMFGIPVNTSIDPITAVVTGAAYFAGMQVMKESREVKTNLSGGPVPGLQIQTAYERLVRTDETALLYRSAGNTEGKTLRLSRTDGGFDSGILSLKPNGIMQLPLLGNVFNEFELVVMDSKGDKIFTEKIGITQGKYGIHGQPLPHPIGIEVDDPESNSTFLEVLFKKNAILPLRRTIVKKVAETIRSGTGNAIMINLYEGDIDSIPSANKLIGTIEIKGHDLLRDLVRGSDIELTVEISESRDVKVGAYLVLTNQQFENTFSPSEIRFNASMIRQTVTFFKQNLLNRRQSSEHKGKYEEAGQIQSIVNDIDDLIIKLNAVDDLDSTDEKYMLEIKAREIGKRIHELFNTSLLARVTEEYYKLKQLYQYKLLEKDVPAADKVFFEDLISKEREFLPEGNISVIKLKNASLHHLLNRTRPHQSLTNDEFKNIFIHLKYHPYRDQARASEWIAKGDQAIEQMDVIRLNNITIDLLNLYNQENKSEEYFINRKTGLE